MPSDRPTILLYSDDPGTRERIRLAVGRRPAADLPEVRYLEADTELDALADLGGGEVDLGILDGEAWPAGGLGLCRQAKDEVRHCPPLLVLVGRRDDAWLATWSRADGVLAHPLDPLSTAAAVAALLRRAAARPARRVHGR